MFVPVFIIIIIIIIIVIKILSQDQVRVRLRAVLNTAMSLRAPKMLWNSSDELLLAFQGPLSSISQVNAC
jgi:hypothetical protein